MDTGTDEEVVLACRQVINSCGIGAVLATRSQEGMSLVCRDGTDGFLMPIHIETQAREVFDVSGAGDTVVAVMGAALAAGADFQEAAMLANHAAGIVVGKTGTAPVLFGELENILHSSSAVHSGDSAICYGHDEAEEIINYWRGSGLKVGFTNGCFDIIHAGHVKYLAAARGLCDRLVVGLNVDESVGRLKGPERPVNDEVARAEVLAALEAVDLVVFFGRGEDEADMPVKLIGYLRPDIHFKGGDYRAEDLPEAEIVYSYGGSVEIMSLEEGRSTSKIIGKLAEKQS
jgi:D-beta-D-heptose 7-phosphate kinase/D-beta-D-heptose 1-phosphate adenosyltransferase